MTDATHSEDRIPLWRRRRVFYAVAALLAVFTVAWLLAPRRVWEVASVDEALRWRSEEAPPRRAIVWRPAVEVDSLPIETIAAESAIRPQLADGGATIYFTLRKNGRTDIYRAHRESGEWSQPAPLAEWRSPHDDIGPVLTADGRRAYLYSNRPGGYGGFDLYVSECDDDGQWQAPRNLGPRVNSPAHEYDPAVTPGGERLFFASNRTPEMQKHLEAGGEFDRANPWGATLRAPRDTLPFDLYVVEREKEEPSWSAPRPLAAINLPESSEGSPYVAPGGAFLYFASDRPFREGEAPNFDLYRARMRGLQVVEVENLGRGVNTPLNELEPALSPEGFQIYFSRNREAENAAAPAGETYALYASTAVEVFDDRAWDTSRWSALVGWVASNGWWLLLALLLAALLAAIIWCLREISMRRATVPVFFTLALLVHLFLIAGSFFVGLDDDLIALLPQEMREIIVAEESYDDPNEAAEVPPQPFAQTADLENIERVEPSDIAPQPAASSALPSPITTAVRINTNTPLPPDRMVYEAPAPQEAPPEAAAPSQEAALARRPAEAPANAESAELETLPAAPAAPQQPSPAPEPVDLARSTPAAAAPPRLPTPAMDDSEPLMRDSVAPESTVEPQVAPARTSAPGLARNQQAPADSTGAEQVAGEAIAAPAPQPEKTAPAAEVEVARAAMQPASPPPQRVAMAEASPDAAPSFDAEAIAEAAESAAPPPSTTAPVDAPRRAAFDLAAAEEAPTAQAEEAPAAEAMVEADAAEALRAEVALSRQATAAPVTPDRQRREITLAAASPQMSKSGALAPERTDSDAAPEASRREIRLARLSFTSPQEGEVMEGAKTLDADFAPTERAEAAAEGPQVAVARASAEGPAGPESLPAQEVEPTNSTAMPVSNEQARAEIDLPPPSSRISGELRRSASLQAIDEAEMVEAAPAVELAEAEGETTEAAAAEVALDRQAAALPGSAALLPVSMKRINGPRRPLEEEGEPLVEQIAAAPAVGRRAGDLARRDSRSPQLMYAEDDIGLQAMLRLRQSEAKEDLLQAFGGSDKTEAAVRRGLAWLAQHQHRDGHWSLDKFHELCQEHHPKQKCGGHGRSADTAATGFALLPFLGAGHTHQEGEYTDQVNRGLTWLVSNQKENGDLFTGGGGNGHMYSHGVAAIALCEAYAMTNDARLRGPAQRAIDFIASAQHKGSGGWRYSPGQDGDTSVYGWQIMALKSGEIAGLDVPEETLERAKKWLDRVGAKGDKLGQFGYTNAHPSPAMSAEALLCLQYLGAERNDPRLLKGGDYLLAHLPPRDTSYYWYYATQVMYHLQGEYWREWNEAQRDALVNSQKKDGPAAGTWDPKDRWERDGGRLYATSLRLLMLEVYYRHLPLYQALE